MSEVIPEIYHVPVFFELMIYSFVAVIGFFGNSLTCFTIVRNKEMHTTVNCYLFALAVSDLMLLVVLFPKNVQNMLTSNTDLDCQLG